MVQQRIQIQQQQNQSQTIENIEDKNTKFIGVNYINGLTENLGTLFKKYAKDKNIGYKPTKTVRHLQKSKKDPLPKMAKSNVVYSLECKGCEKVYIGQTGQKIKNRTAQHKSDQRNKHIISKNKTITGSLKHTLETGHVFKYDYPNILHIENNLRKRLTLEMLYISSHENTVNLKSDVETLDSTYAQLLHL